MIALTNILSNGFWNSVWGTGSETFINLCFAIDSVIYSLISWLYSVFITIAKARILTSKVMDPLIERLYLVIGIFALFFAAYTFINVIINPDNISKGDSSPVGFIKNIVISILALTFIPTVFNFAYSVQSSILDSNIITKIFLDPSTIAFQKDQDNYSSFGTTMFQASFFVTNSSDTVLLTNYQEITTKYVIPYNDIKWYTELMPQIKNEEITYNYGISGAIGIFVAYVFLVYCIDVGIRAIKLCFLEVMAPLPALLLMVPGQKKMFQAWIKEVLKTFFEIFIKIAIVVFGVFMINLVKEAFDSNQQAIFGNVSNSVLNFSKLFVFVGICIFIKRAPKLISDIFGIDMSENGLSLKKRFDEFKESIAPVTNFASRAAGLVGGTIAARRAYKQGLALGNKGSALKSGLATFHGMRNGWNGGIKNIGKAYDYELAVQGSYAFNKDKGTMQQIGAGISDSLRDNFGFGSRYDYMVKRAEIERDFNNANRLDTIRSLRSASDLKISQINNGHKAYIDDNQELFDLADKRNEILEKELSKNTSTEKLSMDDLMHRRSEASNPFKTEFKGKKYNWQQYQDAIKEARNAGNMDEYEALKAAQMDWNHKYDDYMELVSGRNWSALEAERKRTNDNTEISESQRKQIIDAINAAQDALKNQYNEKDSADQLSSYVTINEQIKQLANLEGTKIGVGTKRDDATGHVVLDTNGQVIDDTSLQQLIRDIANGAHGQNTFDLKKELGKLIDKENQEVNRRLANDTIKDDIYFYDETGKKVSAKGKSLLEISKIIKNATTLYEEENKRLEKLRESLESAKQDAETHKSLKKSREDLASMFSPKK